MKKQQQGFTLVELITVILIVGILSAVAFSRFADNSLYTQTLFNAKLKAYLRYAQQIAIAQQTASSAQTSLSLTQIADSQWQVTITGVQGSQVFTLKNSDSVTLNNQPIERQMQLNFTFNHYGDIASQQLSPLDARTSSHSSAYRHSSTLQVGSQSLCIAPTGYSYAGQCI